MWDDDYETWLREQRNPFTRERPRRVRMTREEWAMEFPHQGEIPPMRSVNDVIRTLEQITTSALESSSESSDSKEVAALAAEVLGEVALYTLTIHTGTEASEASFARLVTRHFAKYGITPKSLKDLQNIFVATRQVMLSDDSQ